MQKRGFNQKAGRRGCAIKKTCFTYLDCSIPSPAFCNPCSCNYYHSLATNISTLLHLTQISQLLTLCYIDPLMTKSDESTCNKFIKYFSISLRPKHETTFDLQSFLGIKSILTAPVRRACKINNISSQP